MQDQDTQMGGNVRGFPTTRWSTILRAREPGERRDLLASLLTRYWRPVYLYIRVVWKKSNEETKDLTQEFFSFVLEKDVFQKADPAKGRMRSFLKTCLRNFLKMDRESRETLKRGGAARVVSLNDEEVLEAAAEGIPDHEEEAFDRAWVGELLKDGLEALRREMELLGRGQDYEMFCLHDVEPPAEGAPSYSDLATAYGLSVQHVKSALDFARTQLRKTIREIVLESCETEAEAQEEFRELFSTEAEWGSNAGG